MAIEINGKIYRNIQVQVELFGKRVQFELLLKLH